MDVNFVKLAQEFPTLKKHFNEEGKYDFGRDGAVYDITEVILESEYSLKINLDRRKLCPRIPNRLAYIQWCDRLISEKCELNRDNVEGFIGIDIGTGSSAIYPLLGLKSSKYIAKYIATDIDAQSITHAGVQIDSNDLKDKVTLVRVTDAQQIISPTIVQGDKFDNFSVAVTMCNPPFYKSHQDLTIHAQNKPGRLNKLTASDTELIYNDGGEAGFVERYVEQSLLIEDPSFRDCWFTSQLGFKETCYSLDKKMQGLRKKQAIKSYIIEELVIPSASTSKFKTKRWVMAWTVHSQFRYPIPRFQIPHFPRDLVYDKFSTFPFCKVYYNANDPHFYLESEHPTWTRRLQRQIKFQRLGFLKDKQSRCIFKVTDDCLYWVYGEDLYSWESIKTYSLKLLLDIRN